MQALFAIGISPCVAYPYTTILVRRYFCLCGDTFLGSTPCLSRYVAVHPKLQNPTVLTSYDYLLMHTGYVEFALNGAGKEWRKSTCARNVNHILRPIALFRECQLLNYTHTSTQSSRLSQSPLSLFFLRTVFWHLSQNGLALNSALVMGKHARAIANITVPNIYTHNTESDTYCASLLSCC